MLQSNKGLFRLTGRSWINEETTIFLPIPLLKELGLLQATLQMTTKLLLRMQQIQPQQILQQRHRVVTDETHSLQLAAENEALRRAG